MGLYKNFLTCQLEDLVAELASKTGYDEEFLWDMYWECMEDGCDIDYFIQVTLERDW